MCFLLWGVMTPISLCDSLPIMHWIESKHTHTQTHTCINLHGLHDDVEGDSKAAGWLCGSDKRMQRSKYIHCDRATAVDTLMIQP